MEADTVAEQRLSLVSRIIEERKVLDSLLTALWHENFETAEATTLATVRHYEHFHLRSLAYYRKG